MFAFLYVKVNFKEIWEEISFRFFFRKMLMSSFLLAFKARGIEWSLQAFASASTALIFASTSDDQFSHASSEQKKNTNGEHWAHRKFSAAGIFKLLFHAKLSGWYF